MSVDKFRELGKDRGLYANWRAEQIAARSRKQPRKEIVKTVVEYRDRVIERLQEVKDRVDGARKDEPSEAFMSLLEPGETIERGRVRLSERFDELQTRVANDAATDAQQAEYEFLYGIYYELKERA